MALSRRYREGAWFPVIAPVLALLLTGWSLVYGRMEDQIGDWMAIISRFSQEGGSGPQQPRPSLHFCWRNDWYPWPDASSGGRLAVLLSALKSLCNRMGFMLLSD